MRQKSDAQTGVWNLGVELFDVCLNCSNKVVLRRTFNITHDKFVTGTGGCQKAQMTLLSDIKLNFDIKLVSIKKNLGFSMLIIFFGGVCVCE